VEWPTVMLILACYAGWLAAGLYLWPGMPVLALALLALAVAFQSSLMHEASHGHPTRNGLVNELLVGLPIGLVYPFRRFRTLHLRHHADESLTDPFDDPESYYKALWQHRELPALLRTLLEINNTMVGRFVLGPILANAAFLATEAKLLTAGDPAVRKAWLHHAVGLAIVLPVIAWGFGMSIWLYALVPVWLGQSFIAIRTFAEHQWSERPDGRTIIVERSPLALLFLNNNLHLVHHKQPQVAWYRLPRLFREQRDEWIAMNGGYFYPNYLALLKDFAFRAKEPVVHPFLRRVPEIGRAFRPRVRARSVQGLGTAPVPAQPPKE
jgi:fatty acid desaturase